MTRIILCYLAVILFNNYSYGQNKRTKIDVYDISVSNINFKTSLKEVIEKLGKANEHNIIDDSEGETSDIGGIHNHLFFNEINFRFFKATYSKKDLLRNITITDSYTLKIKNKEVKIGNNYDVIKNILPYEYNKFKEKNSILVENKEYRIIGAVTYFMKEINAWLEESHIVFWIKNDKITKISISFPEP